jgi:PAS domain S-box-containing protein
MTPSCERITGYSQAEFVADPGLLNQIILPEDRHLMEEHLSDAAYQDEATVDFRIARRDGAICWIAHGCRAVYGPNGQFLGRRASNRDVTERKQAEEAVRLLNATLDQRVTEEVAKNLAQERLLIRQSRLAAMGEMIGNIAHQWRQPLNALGLLLSNIKDANDYHELDTAMVDEQTAKGRQLIDKMSTTIDDFRNFFKPNKAKEYFGLAGAVEKTLELIDHSLKNNGTAIHVAGGENIQINGFPNEFSQVLLNIFNNAKDAIRERKVVGGHIEVSLGQDGKTAWVAIQDNAGGIPDDILAKIFDPYFTTKEKGTGIGLYMSKMIMEHMDGIIEARNIGDGAEFRLVLPLERLHDDLAKINVAA